MNILDFIILTILAIALVRGLLRGVIRQTASLVGIFVAFVVAGHFYLRLLPVLQRFLPTIPHPEAVCYLAIYIVTWVIIILLSLLLVRISRVALMGWADHLLGGVFGLLKGAVAAVVMVAVLTFFLPSKSSLLMDSRFVPYVQRAGYYLVQLTPEDFRQKYHEKHDALGRQLEKQDLIRKIKKKIRG